MGLAVKRRGCRVGRVAHGVLALLALTISACAQEPATPASVPTPATRAARFLRGRSVAATTPAITLRAQTRAKADSTNISSAQALDTTRQQHAALLAEQRSVAAQSVQPRISPLNAAWQSVGSGAVSTPAYGNISGRVTSTAIDPADSTGNTIYIGTTGGGIWKSTNAAGSAAAVTFTPLTDTLPVFSANAGSAATASLSIGALSLQNGVLLAGTGDPNDASDSYYGSGILRSTDGGVTWTLAGLP
jgi:hypothetical protein